MILKQWGNEDNRLHSSMLNNLVDMSFNICVIYFSWYFGLKIWICFDSHRFKWFNTTSFPIGPGLGWSLQTTPAHLIWRRLQRSCIAAIPTIAIKSHVVELHLPVLPYYRYVSSAAGIRWYTGVRSSFMIQMSKLMSLMYHPKPGSIEEEAVLNNLTRSLSIHYHIFSHFYDPKSC